MMTSLHNIQSIAIYRWNAGMLGLQKEWRFSHAVTWHEYERMALNQKGEGTDWKAELIENAYVTA
jgi:hypothetical protein